LVAVYQAFWASVKIVAREDTGSTFGVSTTGTDVEPILRSSEPPAAAEPIPKILVG